MGNDIKNSADRRKKISQICGILSLITCITGVGGAAFGIIAVIQARKTGKGYRSAAGFVTGIVGLFLSAFALFGLILYLNVSIIQPGGSVNPAGTAAADTTVAGTAAAAGDAGQAENGDDSGYADENGTGTESSENNDPSATADPDAATDTAIAPSDIDNAEYGVTQAAPDEAPASTTAAPTSANATTAHTTDTTTSQAQSSTSVLPVSPSSAPSGGEPPQPGPGGQNGPVIYSDKPVTRTIMLYFVGSDLESNYGMASYDIEEIIGSDADLDWIKIIIQTGGAKKWQNESISGDKTETFQIAGNGLLRVREAKSKNMASPDTLSDFLSYCYENYKSDKYVLILWNHGSGPAYGFGYDEKTKDIMSLAEMGKALKNSPFGLENKLEIIGFDACLMGSVEVAYTLKDYASYMIASQEIVPAWGWDYSFLNKIKPEMTADGIAVTIINSYYGFSNMVAYVRPDLTSDISMSCVSLANLEALEQGLNGLYAKAGYLLEPDYFPDAVIVRDKVKEFGISNTSCNYDLIDMRHLCDLMSRHYAPEAKVLSDALDGAVVYSVSNVPNAGGLSLYFPYRDKVINSDIYEFYKTNNLSGEYTEYLRNFVALLRQGPENDWDMLAAASGRDSETGYFVRLGPEQAGAFASASYQVLTETGAAGVYYAVYAGTDVTLDESGKLYANYEGEMLKLLNPDNGETYPVNMSEQERTEDYVRYIVPVTLSGAAEPGEEAFVQIQTDIDGSNVKILSVIPAGDRENPFIADRRIIDIYEYAEAAFYCPGKTPAYNSDGSLKPFSEWDDAGEGIETVIRLNPDTKDSLVFVRSEPDANAQCHLVFSVRDIYGNTVSSNMIPVNREK